MNSNNGFNFIKGNKRAVLLLHGLTGSPFEMMFFGRALHKAGFDVYCPLLPGHCNGIEDVKRIIWQDLYTFASNKFDEISGLYEEVYLSGLCLGAVIAFALAESKNNIKGISALSTTLFLDGWTMPWFKFLFPLGLYTVLKFFYIFPEKEPYGLKNEAARAKVAAIMQDNDSILNCIPMPVVLELLRMSKFVQKNASKIHTPLILFHSTEDDLTSIKSAKFIYKNASSEIKELIPLNNSYHLITLDNEKEFITNKTIEFFTNLSRFNSDNCKNTISAES